MQTIQYPAAAYVYCFHSLYQLVGYYQLQSNIGFLFRATVTRKVYQRSKLAAHYSLHDGDMLHLLRYICGVAWNQSCYKLKTFVQNNCGTTLKGSDHMHAALCWLSKVHLLSAAWLYTYQYQKFVMLHTTNLSPDMVNQ